MALTKGALGFTDTVTFFYAITRIGRNIGLRLNPDHRTCRSSYTAPSGTPDFRGLTGGVYKT
jgi:hypothetical protein